MDEKDAQVRARLRTLRILAEQDIDLWEAKEKDGGLSDEEWALHEKRREDERGRYDPLRSRAWLSLAAVDGEEEPEGPEDYLGLLDSLSE